MTTVRFLLLTRSEVPASDQWLAPEEREQLARFRIEKRRQEWRMGRYAAKRLLSRVIPRAVEPAAIVVRAADDGAPEAFLHGVPLDVTLSISHGDGIALCATAPGEVRLGCDIERIERRSDAFVQDYFTPAEAARVRSATDDHRPLLANLIWSAKESTLKALREGLRLDTRSVEVESPPDGAALQWTPLACRYADQTFRGWWMRSGARVLTVVSSPPATVPQRVTE